MKENAWFVERIVWHEQTLSADSVGHYFDIILSANTTGLLVKLTEFSAEKALHCPVVGTCFQIQKLSDTSPGSECDTLLSALCPAGCDSALLTDVSCTINRLIAVGSVSPVNSGTITVCNGQWVCACLPQPTIGWHDRSWTISISNLSLSLTVTSNNFISPCRYVQWNCSCKIS